MTKSPKHHHRNFSPFSVYSPKASALLLSAFAVLFILFHIQSLEIPPSSLPHPSWSFTNQWQKIIDTTTIPATTAAAASAYCTAEELDALTDKLRRAVTFLPLKDLRYADKALVGHTWFMSSMYDDHEEGEVQYQQFPSESSHGRLLCLKGRDGHDGSWNSYGLAWPEALPYNATLMKGLTFVSYNHYNYENIWHGLSAVVPFVAWHRKNKCSALPDRWVLYHWGELRLKMGVWLSTLMEATFDGPPVIEGFDGAMGGEDESAVCFEEAVVMRHNEGGMSRERRMEAYDLMRCKARVYCGVSMEERTVDVKGKALPEIGMTLFMRTGPRSFRNESAVVGIFEKECAKVEGCQLRMAYSNNLTFCEQVGRINLHLILYNLFGF